MSGQHVIKSTTPSKRKIANGGIKCTTLFTASIILTASAAASKTTKPTRRTSLRAR
ncbi:exported hypothetical protein [Agrobacterium deltaense NCPPB 1641]|uniref:Uncharacterized protein n=1 Tax=Agrobacterium deltaense NCPPB 1641 TaxID=1183425 RepID=A0A1S7UAY1_9HYPH|nr:exported hypothetical protein [Agrobacterium deltaense NCPPB 1641]